MAALGAQKFDTDRIHEEYWRPALAEIEKITSAAPNIAALDQRLQRGGLQNGKVTTDELVQMETVHEPA